MKRIMMLLIAAVMLFGVTGQAMAAFTNGDLIQVVYQKGGTSEVATDLGAFSSTTAYAGDTVTYNTNPFATAGTGVFATASQSDLYVAYYIAGGSGPVWVSGAQTTQASGARQGSAAQSLTQLNNNYISLGGGSSQVTVDQTNALSYYQNEDKGLASNSGNWAGFIPAKDGEVSLGTTAYVDSYLYYYATPGATSAKAGIQVATIRTFADGTSEIVGTTSVGTVPVPPSVLLLGSGLIGLVGLRRKQSV
jgi:hypothetical protein